MVKLRVILSAACVMLASSLLSTLWGFDIRRAKTEAEIGLDTAGAQAVQLHFRAELTNNSFPDLARQRVVVGWQNAGGIDPQPFRVLIPAGCFVPNAGFHVEDFRGCGVQMMFGRTVVNITEFEARFVVRTDGNARFALEATFGAVSGIDPTPFLGPLGGSATQIVIGSESSAVPPSRAETVSGIDPQPF
ncbi:MAG: hypothetical protein AB1898_18190 [Acidobacteriota bacterium]